MPAIQGNREIAHIHPVQCLTPQDAAAAALAVRERRRALFFVAQAPRIADAPQPVKVEEKKVVPAGPDFSLLLAMFASMEKRAQEENAKKLSLDEIITVTCAVMEVRKADILSDRRTKDVLVPRHIAMALCKALTRRTYPEIGRAFGRDHTSVLFAVRKMEPVMAEVEDAVNEAPMPYLVSITAAAFERIKPPAPVRR